MNVNRLSKGLGRLSWLVVCENEKMKWILDYLSITDSIYIDLLVPT